jgi:hypothetical protein
MVLDTRVLAGNPAAVNAINQKQDTILGNSFYEKADQADKEILMKDKLFEEFNVKDNKREIENFIWRMRIRYGIRESNVFEVLYILTQRGIISADEALQLKKSHSAFTNLKIQIDYVKQSLPQSELDSIVAIYGKLDFEHGSAAAFEEWLFKQAGFNDPEEFEAFYMDLVNKTRNTINSIDSRVGEPK